VTPLLSPTRAVLYSIVSMSEKCRLADISGAATRHGEGHRDERTFIRGRAPAQRRSYKTRLFSRTGRTWLAAQPPEDDDRMKTMRRLAKPDREAWQAGVSASPGRVRRRSESSR
jgi:hypothetical protein